MAGDDREKRHPQIFNFDGFVKSPNPSVVTYEP